MLTGSKSLEMFYFFHSGFGIKTEREILIFDYYREAKNADGSKNHLAKKLIEERGKRKCYVFTSHSHPDHYSPIIYEWQKEDPEIEYVLSEDVFGTEKAQNRTIVSSGDKKKIGQLEIEVFGSTDAGVSFLVKTGQFNIFHAGDLNWWHWNGETAAYNEAMARDYKREIDLLASSTLDLAFVPVDLRLEDKYHWGIKYLFEKAAVNKVVPMHFWQDYSIYEKLKKDLPDHFSKIILLVPGQTDYRIVFP